MENLKTINELSKPENIGYISTSKLKQEAIKWIKELKKLANVQNLADMRVQAWSSESKKMLGAEQWECVKKAEFDLAYSEMKNFESQIIWIKHFFNITDEDLQ